VAGYIRQSTADIIPTATVRAAPINAEYNALRDAFSATGGHKHDGTTGEGEYIPLIADLDALNKVVIDTTNNRIGFFVEVSSAAVEQVRIQDGVILPVTNNDIDLGSNGAKFKNLYIQGTADIGTVDINAGNIDGTIIGSSTPAAATFTSATLNNNLSVTGTSTLVGTTTVTSIDLNSGAIDNTTIGTTTPVAGTFTTLAANTSLTAATADINGGTLDNAAIGSSTPSTAAFTTLSASGTATLATVDINAGNIDNTTIGASNPVAGSFTTVSTSGNATLATANISGGSINGTTVGASSPTTGAFTTLSASGGVTGDLTGNVTGNITGDVTGDLTGNVAGNLTGNVTSTGTSTFNNVTIDGTLNMNAGTTATITNLTDPTNNQDAATKAYVDTSVANLIDSAPDSLNTLNELAAALNDDDDAFNTLNTAIGTKLPKAGGTMTGAIAMGTNVITGLGDPSAAQDAATKNYVDTQDALQVTKSGDTMSGNLAMGNNKITGLGTPTATTDATNKTYVDGILGSATAAASSASAAATSASNAATSETNAASSASAAAADRATVASLYDSFDDRYLGPKSSAPTQDNDGNALIVGALYFNSTNNIMYVYGSGGWQAAGSSVNGTSDRQTYTATAGQTVFAASYDAGYVDVYLNGVKLLAGTDFTATNGTSVTLASGASVNDVVDIVAYGTFVLADHLTQTQSDARYVNLSGDTMTGGLNITVGDNSQLTLEGNDTNPTTIMMDYNSTGSTDRVRIQNDAGDMKFATSNGQVRQTITKAGNVGIGTDLPTAPLTVDNTTNNQIRLRRTASGNNVLAATFSDTGSTGETYVAIGSDGDDLVMRSGGSEAMRLDSSNNLLVGTTDKNIRDSSSAEGMVYRNGDSLDINRSAAPPLIVNRVGNSDGDLTLFRKDGATVGSIGSVSGSVSYIVLDPRTNGSGIRGTTNGLLPTNQAGTATNDHVDLGSDTNAFRNLYLSGGVYLGGTGSANKLTDYEEGSWTPTIGSGSFTYQNARYVKVGDMVTVCANIADITDNTSTSDVQVGGLPFTTVAASQTVGSVMFRYVDAPTNMIQLTPLVNASSSTLIFYWSSSTGATWDGLQYANAKYTNWDMIISVTYRAAG
jgi:hypothetical protein